MGVWGTHYDRNQTWREPAKAAVKYWQRCQALLQWGSNSQPEDDFQTPDIDSGLVVKHIHRRLDKTDVYFVANLTHNAGKATCSFRITGKQPELWDPVTGSMRNLTDFMESGSETAIPLLFDDAQSFFIVSRKNLRESRQGNQPISPQ